VQRRSLAAERQIDKHNLSSPFQLRHHATGGAPRLVQERFNVQLDTFVARVHTNDLDLRKTDQAIEHLLRVNLDVARAFALGRHPVTLAA
jgi:hypothetical protein